MTHCEYIRQFLACPTLCGFFQLLAADTWERIDFVNRRPHIGISEVTITENLMYYLQKYVEQYGDSRILIQEATKETVNGNDLLIYIQAGNLQYYPLAVQAKRLYRDKKYYAFSGKYLQLQNLITYAQTIGGLPVYLLYNFANRPSQNFVNCGISHDWNQFGCSFTSALYVQQICHRRRGNGQPFLSLPNFDDFHRANAIPWMKIACCPWPEGDSIAQISKPPPTYSMKGYTLNELLDLADWINVSEREMITLDYVAQPKEVKKFAPRYRLFVSIGRMG